MYNNSSYFISVFSYNCFARAHRNFIKIKFPICTNIANGNYLLEGRPILDDWSRILLLICLLPFMYICIEP